MDKFVVIYWIGALVLVATSVLYTLGILNLLPFAILGILGLDAMITAVIDFNIRRSYTIREFKHILISEIAFWIGLFVAFSAFFIEFNLLYLGLAIISMSIFDFILTQKKIRKEKILHKIIKKDKKYVSVHKLYSSTWFLSLILIVSSLVNSKWVTFSIALFSMVLSFLGYEKTRIHDSISKKQSLLKAKNYVFYGLMWFASAVLMLLAFINQKYVTVAVAFVLNILSSFGYKLNRPKMTELPVKVQKLEKRNLKLTIEIMFFLGFLILAGSFLLFKFDFIDVPTLYLLGLVGFITIITPLLSFRRFKKKKLIPKAKKSVEKIITIKKNYLFSLEMAYLIGAGLVILSFILFQQDRISLRGLIIFSVIGLLIILVTNLIINSKRHKKVKKIPEIGSKVRSYHLKPFKKISETQLDDMVDIVNKLGIVKLSDMARKFGISKQLAEEWGKILEDHELITLRYHTFGELEFRKWKK